MKEHLFCLDLGFPTGGVSEGADGGAAVFVSPEVRETLIEAIEGGAFDWVAAELAGIGRRTFYDWMRRGEAGEEPFAELLTAVRRARASAGRGGANGSTRDPLSWLRLGPGRERLDEPGWTSPGKPSATGATEGESDKLVREALERSDQRRP